MSYREEDAQAAAGWIVIVAALSIVAVLYVIFKRLARLR